MGALAVQRVARAAPGFDVALHEGDVEERGVVVDEEEVAQLAEEGALKERKMVK